MVALALLATVVLQQLAAPASGLQPKEVGIGAHAAAARRLAAEERVSRLASGHSLIHARRNPPPRPELRAPTADCPQEMAEQVAKE